MNDNIIASIRQSLSDTFADVDAWFDIDKLLMDYRPNKTGWTIRQILEHITLTNYYLLILIKKGTIKSLNKAAKMNVYSVQADYKIDWLNLNTIAVHNSFVWSRPQHMEPTGNVELSETRQKMKDQLIQCLSCLNQMPNGEGALYKTMMSVNNLGKIDVYHYILFLGQHAKRHISQMENIERNFKKDQI
ncbi:DinB family protein [Foetidibacter luteolus]|uniref:DinB family protein n=1 Tax=Foetidibacter luteolus TaxID=2608880 RepID=UPI001A987E2E|nr:DinB family protein [Foetidibacter luteolus]